MANNTVAKVFADYLGMTPENAGWAYDFTCPMCGDLSVGNSNGTEPYECFACFGGFKEPDRTLTATSPLAPEPTPGWLEALVRHKGFAGLVFGHSRFHASWLGDDFPSGGSATDPIHAVARALVAADPALRERLEACADWEG